MDRLPGRASRQQQPHWQHQLPEPPQLYRYPHASGSVSPIDALSPPLTPTPMMQQQHAAALAALPAPALVTRAQAGQQEHRQRHLHLQHQHHQQALQQQQQQQQQQAVQQQQQQALQQQRNQALQQQQQVLQQPQQHNQVLQQQQVQRQRQQQQIQQQQQQQSQQQHLQQHPSHQQQLHPYSLQRQQVRRQQDQQEPTVHVQERFRQEQMEQDRLERMRMQQIHQNQMQQQYEQQRQQMQERQLLRQPQPPHVQQQRLSQQSQTIRPVQQSQMRIRQVQQPQTTRPTQTLHQLQGQQQPNLNVQQLNVRQAHRQQRQELPQRSENPAQERSQTIVQDRCQTIVEERRQNALKSQQRNARQRQQRLAQQQQQDADQNQAQQQQQNQQQQQQQQNHVVRQVQQQRCVQKEAQLRADPARVHQQFAASQREQNAQTQLKFSHVTAQQLQRKRKRRKQGLQQSSPAASSDESISIVSSRQSGNLSSGIDVQGGRSSEQNNFVTITSTNEDPISAEMVFQNLPSAISIQRNSNPNKEPQQSEGLRLRSAVPEPQPSATITLVSPTTSAKVVRRATRLEPPTQEPISLNEEVHQETSVAGVSTAELLSTDSSTDVPHVKTEKTERIVQGAFQTFLARSKRAQVNLPLLPETSSTTKIGGGSSSEEIVSGLIDELLEGAIASNAEKDLTSSAEKDLSFSQVLKSPNNRHMSLNSNCSESGSFTNAESNPEDEYWQLLSQHKTPVVGRDTICIICLQTCTQRQPLLLNCLHSACTECFQVAAAHGQNEGSSSQNSEQPRANDNISDMDVVIEEATLASSSVTCPLCKVATKKNEAVTNLFVNIQEDVDSDDSRSRGQETPLCNSCEDATQAILWCRECEESLCEECVNAHKRVKVTRDHTLTPLVKTTSSTDGLPISQNECDDSMTEALFCSTHENLPLTLYSESQSRLACEECRKEEVLKRPSSSSSPDGFVSIAEASKALRYQLTQALSQTRLRQTVIDENVALLDTKIKQFSIKERSLSRQMQELSATLIALIRDHFTRLESQAKEALNHRRDVVEGRKGVLERLQIQSNYAQCFLQHGLKNDKTDRALLLSKRLLERQLRRLHTADMATGLQNLEPLSAGSDFDVQLGYGGLSGHKMHQRINNLFGQLLSEFKILHQHSSPATSKKSSQQSTSSPASDREGFASGQLASAVAVSSGESKFSKNASGEARIIRAKTTGATVTTPSTTTTVAATAVSITPVTSSGGKRRSKNQCPISNENPGVTRGARIVVPPATKPATSILTATTTGCSVAIGSNTKANQVTNSSAQSQAPVANIIPPSMPRPSAGVVIIRPPQPISHLLQRPILTRQLPNAPVPANEDRRRQQQIVAPVFRPRIASVESIAPPNVSIQPPRPRLPLNKVLALGSGPMTTDAQKASKIAQSCNNETSSSGLERSSSGPTITITPSVTNKDLSSWHSPEIRQERAVATKVTTSDNSFKITLPSRAVSKRSKDGKSDERDESSYGPEHIPRMETTTTRAEVATTTVVTTVTAAVSSNALGTTTTSPTTTTSVSSDSNQRNDDTALPTLSFDDDTELDLIGQPSDWPASASRESNSADPGSKGEEEDSRSCLNNGFETPPMVRIHDTLDILKEEIETNSRRTSKDGESFEQTEDNVELTNVVETSFGRRLSSTTENDIATTLIREQLHGEGCDQGDKAEGNGRVTVNADSKPRESKEEKSDEFDENSGKRHFVNNNTVQGEMKSATKKKKKTDESLPTTSTSSVGDSGLQHPSPFDAESSSSSSLSILPSPIARNREDRVQPPLKLILSKQKLGDGAPRIIKKLQPKGKKPLNDKESVTSKTSRSSTTHADEEALTTPIIENTITVAMSGSISPSSNEDWCAVCHDGGDVLYCCDRCPKVFHPQCYIPPLTEEPPDDWVCLMCATPTEVRMTALANSSAESTTTQSMSAEHKLICRRLLFELYNVYPHSSLFSSVLELQVPQYMAKIKEPIALDVISSKLDSYRRIESFLKDLRMMFENCYKFHSSDSQCYAYGKELEQILDTKLETWVPHLAYDEFPSRTVIGSKKADKRKAQSQISNAKRRRLSTTNPAYHTEGTTEDLNCSSVDADGERGDYLDRVELEIDESLQ